MDRDKVRDFYALGMEANRLEEDTFKLEGIRTKEIIDRYLPGPSMEILDIGGGTGYYSFWLQEKGHNVTLVDLTPGNIELANKFGETIDRRLKHLEIGDAVNLNFADDQFDIVLLMGPLYHLTERSDRNKALSEAKRVLKPKGILIAAVISRYASLIDGFNRDLAVDDQFFDMLRNDLKTGIHQNDTDNLEYFTTAYFHTIQEIRSEIGEAGLKFEKLIPVEGLGWIVRNFSKKEKNLSYMKKLLETIRMLEGNEDLTAMSPHILAVARKD